MRRILLLFVAVLMTAGFVFAQTHENATEKVAKDTITFSTPVRIGTTVLPAGEYRVVCNREQISFKPTAGGKTLEMPCKGPELKEAKKVTEMHMTAGPDGVRTLDKLYLRGSAVEHTFK